MNKYLIKFCFFSIVLLLVSINGEAQSGLKNELPRGIVIEKVVCPDDHAQSYALYIPTNYTPEKKWAILYAFDPSAQGKVPVEIFREAAEKFGFIVVGSNNSRNSLDGQELSGIINAFWADTHARFGIDENRTYAAGLSGGARVANSFAASCGGCIAGVVASGATFSRVSRSINRFLFQFSEQSARTILIIPK
jgi:poly(3-hydroxybutyrate) depolymerase